MQGVDNHHHKTAPDDEAAARQLDARVAVDGGQTQLPAFCSKPRALGDSPSSITKRYGILNTSTTLDRSYTHTLPLSRAATRVTSSQLAKPPQRRIHAHHQHHSTMLAALRKRILERREARRAEKKRASGGGGSGSGGGAAAAAPDAAPSPVPEEVVAGATAHVVGPLPCHQLLGLGKVRGANHWTGFEPVGRAAVRGIMQQRAHMGAARLWPSSPAPRLPAPVRSSRAPPPPASHACPPHRMRRRQATQPTALPIITTLRDHVITANASRPTPTASTTATRTRC